MAEERLKGLTLEVTADITQAQKNLKQLEKDAKASAKPIENSFKNIGSLFSSKELMEKARIALQPSALQSMKYNFVRQQQRAIPAQDTTAGLLPHEMPVKALESNFSSIMEKATALNGQISQLSTSFHQLGLSISAIASIPMALFAKSSIMAASDFVEWKNVFDQTFKTIIPQASKEMENLRSTFDLSSRTAQRVVGDIGELAAGIGFTEKESLKLSMQINRLAGDIVSFRNIPGGIQKASHMMFMGAMGNSQSLKTLGIALRQNSPEFKKLEKQIMATNGVTMQQARFLAVLQEATKQSRYAVGDYTRTWFTFANSLRRVGEYLTDLSIEFGKILIDGLGLNYVLTAIGVTIKTMAFILKMIPAPFKTFIGLFTLAVIAIGPLITAIGMSLWALNGAINGYTALRTLLPVITDYYTIYTAKIKANTAALIANNIVANGGIVASLKKFGNINVGSMKGIGDSTKSMFTGFLGFLGMIIGVIPKLIAGIKYVFSIFSTPIILALAAAVGSLYFAFQRLSNMDWKGGIFGAAFDKIVQPIDAIKQKVQSVFSFVYQQIEMLVAFVIENISTQMDIIDSIVSNLALSLYNTFTTFFIFIKDSIANVGQLIVSIIGSAIKNVLNPKQFAEDIKAFAGTFIKSIGISTGKAKESLFGDFSKTLGKNFFSEMKDNFAGIFDRTIGRVQSWQAETPNVSMDEKNKSPFDYGTKYAEAALYGTTGGVKAMFPQGTKMEKLTEDIKNNTKASTEELKKITQKPNNTVASMNTLTFDFSNIV